jgi:putative ABC transport system permease protein
VNSATIAWRSLSRRRLSTILTAAGVALGTALALFVFHVRGATRSSYDAAARGVDVVIGGLRTSSITSVLSTIFHVDAPQDTIPKDAYDDVKRDPRVAHAIPYALGDMFRGHRIVGTSKELFDVVEDAQGQPLRQRIRAGGRLFSGGDEFEAILGSIVADRTGLGVGSTFDDVTHGFAEGGHLHHETWTVVGVLDPTGTPNDRAVFVPLGAFFHIGGHEDPDAKKKGGKDGADGGSPDGTGMGGGTPDPAPTPDTAHGDEHGGPECEDPTCGCHEGTKVWAVSSILVRLKVAPMKHLFVADMNKRTDLRAAIPQREIGRLFSIVSNVDGVFRALALLVVLTAGLMILVGLYNTMEGRRREIAILRALGATPGRVFGIVTLEAVLTCLLGGAAGLLAGHAGVAAAAPFLLESTGVLVDPGPSLLDGAIVAGLLLLGALAGLVPAFSALRTPVAKNLHPVD